MGGYERHPEPWGLDGIRRTSTESSSRKTGSASTSSCRTPWSESRAGEPRGRPAHRRAEAFTPTRSSSSANQCAASVAARLLRAWPRRSRWDGAARGGVDRERDPQPRRLEWIRAASGTTTRAASTRSSARQDLLDYYDIKYPGPERLGAALRTAPTYSGCRIAPPSARSRAGSARTGSSRTPPRDESLRPRGWAGEVWSPAIGAEHRACREAAAALRRDLLLEDRVAEPGGLPQAPSANQESLGTSALSPTRRC